MHTTPLSDEYPEYYGKYISLIPDGDIHEVLTKQRTDTLAFLNSIPEELAARAYAPGKWSLGEVVGHMTDTERVMSYRMLCIARGEDKSLPGFDQDSYVASANFDRVPWKQLRIDFDNVRSATLSLITTIDQSAWVRRGIMSNSSVSVRAIAYIIAGHEQHHLTVIRNKYM